MDLLQSYGCLSNESFHTRKGLSFRHLSVNLHLLMNETASNQSPGFDLTPTLVHCSIQIFQENSRSGLKGT